MADNTPRQPQGIPFGGQFAAASRAESTVTLTAPVRPTELEPYGQIPAPREDQTYADGTPITAAAFDEAYREFFKPLEDHEAEHGPFKPQPGPTEGELQELAGLSGVSLGRERGTWLEEDENGDAVIVVHTRNGGGNRDCWRDDCDGTCTGCIQTDLIPNLPTYLRDEDDEGDSTYANNYFRAVDVHAGRAVVAADRKQRALLMRRLLRRGITEGKCAPWEILSPVHGDEVPYSLLKARRDAVSDERNHERYVRLAEGALAALQAGKKLPQAPGVVRSPSGQINYDIAIANAERYRCEAAEARSRQAALDAEISDDLPPVVRALADAELARVSAAAVKAETKLAEQTVKVAAARTVVTEWAQDQINKTSRYAQKTAAAEAAVENFHWGRSWPGELADCPPKPATDATD